MIIIGAGLAGLLAANMLHYLKPKVYEAQNDLPNNHSAVLRFKESTFGDVCGIQFKQVKLIKTVVPWRNAVADALAYSNKNLGYAYSNRSITQEERDNGIRYIAPPDLIAKLAERTRLHLGWAANFKARTVGKMAWGKDEPTISTVPMPVLMDQLEWPHRDQVSFSYRPGVNVHARITGCDAYVGLAFPDPELPYSRVSITGDNLIVEGGERLSATCIHEIAQHLGIDEDRFVDITVHRQRYQKINSIDNTLRKEFIFWATHEHNIYSLGRFATWRPGLLLDSLVNDVRMIEKWANTRDNYSLRRRT